MLTIFQEAIWTNMRLIEKTHSRQNNKTQNPIIRVQIMSPLHDYIDTNPKNETLYKTTSLYKRQGKKMIFFLKKNNK